MNWKAFRGWVVQRAGPLLPSLVMSLLIFGLLVNGESALYKYVATAAGAVVVTMNAVYLVATRKFAMVAVALGLPVVATGLGLRVYCWRLSACSQVYYDVLVSDRDGVGSPWCFAVVQKNTGRRVDVLRLNVKARLHVAHIENESRERFVQDSPFGTGVSCYYRIGDGVYSIMPCPADGRISLFERLLHGHCGSSDCLL